MERLFHEHPHPHDHDHRRPRWFGGPRGFRGRPGGPPHGGPPHGPGHHGPRGRGARGTLKYDILAALVDGPRHGYDIMLTIEEERGMRPSPGSIYPALQLLTDEECVTGEDRDGKRVYTITEKGREVLERHQAEGGFDRTEAEASLFETIGRVGSVIHGVRSAIREIHRSRDPELVSAAIGILERTRRELYELLASR